jgi:hypothetical protein
MRLSSGDERGSPGAMMATVLAKKLAEGFATAVGHPSDPDKPCQQSALTPTVCAIFRQENPVLEVQERHTK